MCGMYGSFVLSVIVNDKYVPSPSLINYQLIKSDQEREREREKERSCQIECFVCFQVYQKCFHLICRAHNAMQYMLVCLID